MVQRNIVDSNKRIPKFYLRKRIRLNKIMGVIKHEEEINLTVMKTSLFFAGDGFSVYDSNARLAFRVDSCGGNKELVLMDPRGRCLFSLRRKWRSLHQRWEGYAGEFKEDGSSKPIFGVRRSSIIGRSGVTVEMYTPPGDHEYHIEGSFANRSCTVYDSSGEAVVAKICRKVDSGTNVVLGKDVFLLSVKPRFDAAFAMALVLALDKITGDGDGDVVAVDGASTKISNFRPKNVLRCFMYVKCDEIMEKGEKMWAVSLCACQWLLHHQKLGLSLYLKRKIQQLLELLLHQFSENANPCVSLWVNASTYSNSSANKIKITYRTVDPGLLIMR
ncbi:uncharacterized protein [Phyllobates terribilis]|uniref:uncharacterized protein n=1 Tax=Phyllobates terribilis TaxID=111132 RepID=UPI003CCB2D05